MPRKCHTTNYIGGGLNALVFHNLLAMRLITGLVRTPAEKTNCFLNFSKCWDQSLRPPGRALPNSSHMIRGRSTNHSGVRGARWWFWGWPPSWLSLSCAHLERSKATQLYFSDLCRIPEVFAEGEKMMFWKEHEPGDQIRLDLDPGSAICWPWSLGEVMSPL